MVQQTGDANAKASHCPKCAADSKQIGLETTKCKNIDAVQFANYDPQAQLGNPEL